MNSGAPPNSSTSPWQPDKGTHPTIIERYQILGVIGQGGMGTVFKGYHVNLRRFVAIKTLRMGTRHSEALLERFRREMAVIGQMDHPNVVRATDAGEKNGIIYLVMEHLTGLDLGRLVSQQGPLKVGDACELARQTALGLHYIHQTLVHRDIKPSNLMLTSSGLVKVLDLGLARPGMGQGVEGELTPRGCAVGTFAYIAPEQATVSSLIDGRADIYSLGCTLYKLLTNQTPFSGPEYDSPAKQIQAHCHVPLSSAPGFAALADELKPVLFRMMAKDPAERYATGQEVADALAPFAADSQNLQQLVATAASAAPTPLQPLGQPFPEEISRLTVAAGETSPHSSLVSEPVQVTQPQGSSKRRGWYLGIGALLLGIAAALYFILTAAAPVRQPVPLDPDPIANPPVRPSGPRLLDAFALHKHHMLLDEPPQPIGRAATADTWKWDKDRETVTVDGPELLLLQLGTTTRQRFTLECAIIQNPWVGNVGLFWGYRENAAAKNAKAPNQEFAWFQTIMIHCTVDGKAYSVRRASVSLRHNERGQVFSKTHTKAKQDVLPLFTGETILVIQVAHDALAVAWLGSAELPDLRGDAANQRFEKEPSQGILGLVSMGYHATFSKARFQATPND